jgi:two-component sensor histidine kinase
MLAGSPTKQGWIKSVGEHPLLRQKPLFAFAMGCALVVLAIAVRLALRDSLQGVPYLTLFPAIAISAFVGGWVIGLLITILGGLSALYFLLPPLNSFHITTISDLWGLVGFGVTSFILVGLTHIAIRTVELNVALANQRQVLLMELQHRIKNHLQLLGAMLATHAKAATNERIRARLVEAGQRLQVMAATYDNLYEPGASIDIGEHLRKVCSFVENGVALDGKIEVDALSINWPVERVVPLSLIAHELLTNAVKHGTSGEALSVNVKLERDKKLMRLSVLTRDASLPADFQLDGGGLGLRIASMLAAQLKGKLMTPCLPQALFVVEFPE